MIVSNKELERCATVLFEHIDMPESDKRGLCDAVVKMAGVLDCVRESNPSPERRNYVTVAFRGDTTESARTLFWGKPGYIQLPKRDQSEVPMGVWR